MGEFQKRVKQNTFYVVRTEDDTFSGHVLKWQTVMRIVEEAKKAFPHRNLDRLELEVSRRLIAKTGDIDATQRLNKLIEVLTWFDRWFG